MKTQYLISTDGNWQTMFGRAVFAIRNISGSGRKLTLRSLEIQPLTMAGATALATVAKATLYKGASIVGGEDVAARALTFDSATALPSTVKVKRGGALDTYASRLRAVTASRFGAASGSQNTLNTHRSWGKLGGLYRSELKGIGAVEPITVNNGEAVALFTDTAGATSPLRVHLVLSINGKTSIWEYVYSTLPGTALVSVENQSAGNTVKILSIGLQEVGNTDTPYFRVVPLGQLHGLDETDSSAQNVVAMPMDSTYGSLSSSVCKIYSDVGFIPQGVPENYIADGSTGTPKGFNYLHTKDFNGPVLRVLFPEMEVIKWGAAAEDMIGHHISHKRLDLGVRRAGIVINPGEGIAVVASAETAVGVQAGYSGWTSHRFSCVLDNEPQASPYLTLTGLQTGSDVVLLSPGTSTVLTSVDSIGSSSFSWGYDPDVISGADICIYKAGYRPYTVRNLSLGLSGATVPVAQVVDPNYSNP